MSSPSSSETALERWSFLKVVAEDLERLADRVERRVRSGDGALSPLESKLAASYKEALRLVQVAKLAARLSDEEANA